MRSALGILMLGVVSACGPAGETLPVRGTTGGPTLLSAACEGDESCPTGMVCQGCNGPHDAQCVPGCRTDAQCPRLHVCRGPVQCATCPCAPGWCELDPCRDVDGDGFAFTLDRTVSCPGKQVGDCNDGSASQRPGARELCANFVDDDCDGKTDRDDESCQVCDVSSQACNDASECGEELGALRCAGGCCLSCPLVEPPRCGTDEQVVSMGFDPETNCRLANRCVKRSPCALLPFQPVCGSTFVTFRNRCVAEQVDAGVLHEGGCLFNEGRPCERYAVGTQGNCEGGQVCTLVEGRQRCVRR